MIESASTSAVRFFTSAALRKREEVPGEAVDWLPRSITVEYDGDQPVTGVWRSRRGARRVCWYAEQVTPALIAAHQERYGDEPFWVIDRSALRDRRVTTYECDGTGRVQAVRTWVFDEAQMPLTEEERDGRGRLVVSRTYECVDLGVAVGKREQRAGAAPVDLPRPHRFPAPELAGEPFPCGGTIGADGPRIIETLVQNQWQGRFVTIDRESGVWRRGLATTATSKGWKPEIRPILDFADPQIAPRIRQGELLDYRYNGYAALGVVEAMPEGRDLDTVVEAGTLAPRAALALALEVAAVAGRAHVRGHQLGGIRPELIYVREADGGVALTQIAHRGPAVLSQYYGGEAILFPPRPFIAEFATTDDATGLAMTLWYMITGGHPWIAPQNLRWDDSWREFRQGIRTRQPWTGPASLGNILEAALFGGAPLPFDVLVATLRAVTV
ncbi:MAG: hypothetical protein JNK64_13200 [Myxococcales bacterium]|nr:hypothetical protein [Myxococcales bacterium]